MGYTVRDVMKHETALLLHNIRSSHNVGSIFRTADAAGVSKIYLSGYTPIPIDRFGRVQKEIAKTALGAEEYISWEYAKTPGVFLKQARADGFQVVGVEQDRGSREYYSFSVTRPTLFLFGNEVRGLSLELRKSCDVLLEIPMRGKKESLNVAVTAGIILFSTQKH
jgi:23S rRNA (guanosine2251-2'-O)-methyltransferase